jgi:hypothetical protein
MPRCLNESWCTICSEVCNSHPTVCTTCGNRLQTHPNQRNSSVDSSHLMDNVHAVANMVQQQQANGTIPIQPTTNWNTLLEQFQMHAPGDVNRVLDEWHITPPEVLNPITVSAASRPTSSECIKQIPRIKIQEQSAILHEVTISLLLPPDPFQINAPIGGEKVTSDPLIASSNIKRKQIFMDAVMGEFPPYPPYEVNGRLIYGGTGKNSNTTSGDLKIFPISTTATIAYMERGDITFVQKAIAAQRQGCCAVICGNNVPVWPYVMKDLTLEASKMDLKIPVVMVKRSDGVRIRELLLNNDCHQKNSRDVGSIRATITAKRLSRDSEDCVVCREPFEIGDIVMRLPFCSHAFHNDCALSWLTKHNTCPFCRRELPTDDPVYEAERRQQQRTHAGSNPEREIDSSWDSLFG